MDLIEFLLPYHLRHFFSPKVKPGLKIEACFCPFYRKKTHVCFNLLSAQSELSKQEAMMDELCDKLPPL